MAGDFWCKQACASARAEKETYDMQDDERLAGKVKVRLPV